MRIKIQPQMKRHGHPMPRLHQDKSRYTYMYMYNVMVATTLRLPNFGYCRITAYLDMTTISTDTLFLCMGKLSLQFAGKVGIALTTDTFCVVHN